MQPAACSPQPALPMQAHGLMLGAKDLPNFPPGTNHRLASWCADFSLILCHRAMRTRASPSQHLTGQGIMRRSPSWLASYRPRMQCPRHTTLDLSLHSTEKFPSFSHHKAETNHPSSAFSDLDGMNRHF